MEDKNKNLFYLHNLPDYKVAHDHADVRGWDVKDTDHRTIGKVDGLLVSKKDERVVYLDVKVDQSIIEKGHEVYSVPASEGIHEFLNKDGDDHLIIPIGMVNLDEEDKLVHSNEITHDTFAKTKRFSKGDDINRNYEIIIYSQYFPETGADDKNGDADFYNRKGFQQK